MISRSRFPLTCWQIPVFFGTRKRKKRKVAVFRNLPLSYAVDRTSLYLMLGSSNPYPLRLSSFLSENASRRAMMPKQANTIIGKV